MRAKIAGMSRDKFVVQVVLQVAFCLITLAFVLWLNKDWWMVFGKVTRPCTMKHCGMWRPPPYPQGVDFCSTSEVHELHAILNHIRVHVGKRKMVTAAEFGCGLNAIYLADRDLFLVNPVILPSPANVGSEVCFTKVNGVETEKLYPKTVTLTSGDYDAMRRTLQFDKTDACLVHAGMEIISQSQI